MKIFKPNTLLLLNDRNLDRLFPDLGPRLEFEEKLEGYKMKVKVIFAE